MIVYSTALLPWLPDLVSCWLRNVAHPRLRSSLALYCGCELVAATNIDNKFLALKLDLTLHHYGLVGLNQDLHLLQGFAQKEADG